MVIAAGFWCFVRARRGEGDREGFTDAAIFTVGSVLVSWVLLMRPGLESAGESATERVLAAAYPLGDLLMLALLVRLLTTTGSRTPAFRWLVAGNALLLVADCAYQYTSMTETYTGGLITLPWLLSYVCFSTAALHPSMRRLTDIGSGETDPQFTRGRLLALTLASLVAPGTLLLQLALGLRVEAWAVGLSSVVLFLLVVWRMSGLLRRLDEQASRLADLARTDALTNLPNRRTSDAELERLQTRARAEGSPLCVAVLDLDRFKSFNDTFGHQAGDSLLVAAAAAWKAHLDAVGAGAGPERSVMLGRWGGEEFVVLLLGHDLPAAAALIDSLRPTTPAGQTFSAGVSGWDGLESAAEVFARADAALYAAKAGGRDQVRVADPPGPRSGEAPAPKVQPGAAAATEPVT
ncbi:GGDEF domain-containing protein [Kineosporia rhizophila]|uniref:GGDEF domain-containing protein n=1 Tax=Kineosporia rhizophila TaxID=84633 RepID=UPI001E364AC6|nr:GGDEF domain-containing protein [Kineosporia rhizophila]MCE0540456.1 GGDEF domain-containing protein [Kineosporia rhizophila]